MLAERSVRQVSVTAKGCPGEVWDQQMPCRAWAVRLRLERRMCCRSPKRRQSNELGARGGLEVPRVRRACTWAVLASQDRARSMDSGEMRRTSLSWALDSTAASRKVS